MERGGYRREGDEPAMRSILVDDDHALVIADAKEMLPHGGGALKGEITCDQSLGIVAWAAQGRLLGGREPERAQVPVRLDQAGDLHAVGDAHRMAPLCLIVRLGLS